MAENQKLFNHQQQLFQQQQQHQAQMLRHYQQTYYSRQQQQQTTNNTTTDNNTRTDKTTTNKTTAKGFEDIELPTNYPSRIFGFLAAATTADCSKYVMPVSLLQHPGAYWDNYCP